MAFTSVYAYYMRETTLSDCFLNYRVNVILSSSLEVDGNGHMELELVNGIAFVLDNVVFKGASTFLI